MNRIYVLIMLLVPALAWGQIIRCEGPGGEIVYTDRSCEQHDARPIDPDHLPALTQVPTADDDRLRGQSETDRAPAWQDPRSPRAERPADRLPRRPGRYSDRDPWGADRCSVAPLDEALQEECLDLWRWTVLENPNAAETEAGWMVRDGDDDSVLIRLRDGNERIVIECPLNADLSLDEAGARALTQRALAAQLAGNWEAPGEQCLARMSHQADPDLE